MDVARRVFGTVFGKRLATVGGEIACERITGRVRIRRDEHAVAYIDAENGRDAWFGLGFCHGQDRAFQMEGLLRVIRGTLAELIGPDGLPIDRISRRIGFGVSSARRLEVLDDDVREMLEAYAEGVTAGALKGADKKAHEFALLRTEPTPYTPADAIGMLELMSFLLASNWDAELMRLQVLRADGPDALVALDPTYPDWLPVTDPVEALAGPALDRLADDLAVFSATVGVGGGSNNWVISGDRTTTGRPILANDPHLAPAHPSHWYLARVSTPDWTIAGASFPGFPGFPVGFNQHGAWGVTAGYVDNTDLFVEEIGPDGRSVRSAERFEPCDVRTERIAVKGGDDVVEEVLVTPRGPVIGPAMDGEVGAISLRAVWLEPRPIRGFLRAHEATDFASFRALFEHWPALPLNMVYAGADGTIGWQLVGECPVRRKGWGTIPLAGWDPEVGWEPETISVEALPWAVDPDTGFLATANNKPVPDDPEAPFVGSDFIDGYRLARIDEELAARSDWDLAAVAALQMDRRTLPWREIRDVVLSVPEDDEATAHGVELLREWDGAADPDSAAATVYEFLVVELAQRIVLAKAPNAARWALGKGFSVLTPESMMFARRTGHVVRLLRDQPDGWFDRPWTVEIADALGAVVRRLRGRYGVDPDRWRWGTVRPLTFRHPFGEKRPFDRIFNLGPFPWGGDANTVSQTAVSFTEPTANSSFVASMRMAVDVGNWDQNRFVLPGGQSGNPMSPHYADLLVLWRHGGGVSIAFSDEAVELAARHILDLQPV